MWTNYPNLAIYGIIAFDAAIIVAAFLPIV